jgi:hypothetical protein
MMELAGLNEIIVNKPELYKKLNLPYNPTDENVNEPIQVESLVHNYPDLIGNLVKLNPQIDPYFFQAYSDGLWNDVNYTLYELDGGSATIEEFYTIYFNYLYANLLFLVNKDNEKEYYAKQPKFVESALKGKWLVVPGVTSELK